MPVDLFSRARDAYSDGGLRELSFRAKWWMQEGLVKALQPTNDGIYVMEEDWDNLVIIDACPLHIFEDCWDEAADVQIRTSRGETTARFFRENFEGETHYDTIVVSGNAATGDVVDDLEFFKFVGLWGKENFPDFDRRYRDIVPPEIVLDKTLELHAEYPNKRIISHFLQPHPPFVVKGDEKLDPGSKYRDFTAARRGEVSSETIREIYRDNTRYVLKYVHDLTSGLDGKSVVTTDHGTMLGEGVPLYYQFLHPRWSVFHRNRFKYAHFTHLRLPTLVEVPWVELDYESRRDIETANSPAGVEMNRGIIEDQLEALGYRA